MDESNGPVARSSADEQGKDLVQARPSANEKT